MPLPFTVTATDTIKKTPLHDRHLALGARMSAFAGYDMPIQYAGIMQEHLAVRRHAGIFDVSHMGEIYVRGPHAQEFAQHLVTNDVESLRDGRALYTVMCREKGGILDDLIVYRFSAEEYLFVVNAANREKDLNWMVQNNAAKAEIEDASDDLALIAVQGPRSLDIMEKAFGKPAGHLKPFEFTRSVGGPLSACKTAIVSRTGYTGEVGVEIYCDASEAGGVWDALVEAGADRDLQPAGLGARDTLRIEAGFCLYGNEITEETNPLEAGLGWLTKFDKDAFIGKQALEGVRARGPERRLVGFVIAGRGIPRSGYPILTQDEREIGVVTSGTQSPILNRGIGLGYVANEEAHTRPGAELLISARGRTMQAIVRKPPLHKA